MEALLDWIAAHPHWAGGAVFLVAFTESLAVVGLVMPGAFLMFGIGALVALGHLAFLPTMAWAVAGAILGDGLSFWLGHHYQQKLRGLWPFRNHPRLVNRGVDFFHRHGGKSILFGRFVGPVRPIMPAVAGMLGMPVPRYLAINVLSGIAWAPAYLLPGMLFGASLEIAAAVTGRLVLLLLLLAGLFWLTFGLVRGLWRLGAPRAGAAVLRLLDWGRHHPRFAALTAALGDPGGAEARGLAVLAVALLAGAALLFGLHLALLPYPGEFGRALHGLLVGLRTPQADAVLIALTELGDAPFLALYALAVAAGLAWHDRSAALHWLAAAGFAAVAPPLFKLLFQVPRPTPFDLLLGDPALPSGHALRATVLYGFGAVLLARAAPARWRWLPYTLAALLVAAIAFSRPYLGVHWPGDVVAGTLLGLAWVVLLGTAYRVRAPGPGTLARPTAAVLLPLLLLAAIYVPLRLPDDVTRYAAERPPQTLATAVWNADPWPELASRAPETTAADGTPRLAWAAPLAQIDAALARTGWRAAAPPGALDWLRVLNPDAALADLPPLPQVRDGREARSLWLRDGGEGSRLALRLWESGLRVDGTPLWLARLDREEPAWVLGLLAYARAEPADVADLDALAEALAPAWTVRDPGPGPLLGPAMR